MNIKMTQIPQNYAKSVDWIFGAYEDKGVSLADGFQKDSIQNAVGARACDKWENWTCSIKTVFNEKGKFIIVEDSGTEGLTGPNLSSSEIQQMINRGEHIDIEYRLARFTSMNNSGGDQVGGGLYGVGKTIYSVASQDYNYYFDSLRKDGTYVANRNLKGTVFEKALEGPEAIKYIENETGLVRKIIPGTRIIISNPKQELVDAIENGSMSEYIKETWWLILQRMDSTCGIFVNDEKVEFLDNSNYSHKYDLSNGGHQYQQGYRIKHFGFYISDDASNDWHGVSYYRKGMKIGEVDTKEIPEKIKDKFWGYIEVDNEWEFGLAQIEDKIHYGVSSGKKLCKEYQYLKNYVNETIRNLLVEWNYIKDKENKDRKLNEELKKIAHDMQNLFDEMGFEDLGKGPQKPDFDVRWQNIVYPHQDSEMIRFGEKLKFGIRIKNEYLLSKTFKYSLHVISAKDKAIKYEIETSNVKLESGGIHTKQFEINVNTDVAERYEENRIILKVLVQGSGKEKIKELPFFFDIEKPDNSRREVILSLHTCDFPVEGSRRVNYGDILNNISYQIDNKRNHGLAFKLNVSIHNCEDPSHTKIVDIASINGSVNPYEEITISDIPAIKFDEAIYKNYLSKGILELRARLIAAEKSGEFEKGDRITDYKYRIFLNCDEKNGKEDAFDIKMVVAPEEYKRSWIEKSGSKRVICINVAHPAFLFVEDNEEYRYAFNQEQVLKQYLLIYLAEGKYSMFCEPGEKLEELDIITANERIINKIEAVYSKSLE